MNAKLIFILFILLTVVAVGCKKDPFAEFGEDAIESWERTDRTADLANLKTIQNAVRIYRTTNGEYPDELNDIESLIGSQVDFDKYEYNPENGTVKLKNQ